MSKARNFVPAENRRPREPGFGPGDTDRPKLVGDPQLGPDPAEIPPAIDPTSVDGRRRDGVFETGIAPDEVDDAFQTPARSAPVMDTWEGSPDTTAFTGSQEPNLPGADADAISHAQGSGKLQEPVEGRENNLVFDPDTENFTVAGEGQGSGK